MSPVYETSSTSFMDVELLHRHSLGSGGFGGRACKDQAHCGIQSHRWPRASRVVQNGEGLLCPSDGNEGLAVAVGCGELFDCLIPCSKRGRLILRLFAAKERRSERWSEVYGPSRSRHIDVIELQALCLVEREQEDGIILKAFHFRIVK